ncbi:DJ-1/PfpI family protein [Chryseolinea sp. H1M3-3]|uniref:DJ-1/PfpI family protein n=1 Tax=Chryseolinea sp. H1M3-3 TaxID=3034144 RepID=UPI0023EB9853|nr:DJ-1/PfpI family protein [Chryseolinea sp. H1M3-3]
MIVIGMVLFERMTQLDLTGPLEVFSRMPDTTVHLISKTLAPVQSDGILRIIPDTTFASCPKALTVLFIPGGRGISNILRDQEYLDFIKSRGNSTYITSVCTGSIVLAACGLLRGYKATTHWLSIELLAKFNVETAGARVVIDRNRVTGGGVTSGIDFGLTLASILCGEQCAKTIQLLMEYNPEPPFNSGHPDVAEKSVIKMVMDERVETQRKRLEEIENYILQNS